MLVFLSFGLLLIKLWKLSVLYKVCVCTRTLWVSDCMGCLISLSIFVCDTWIPSYMRRWNVWLKSWLSGWWKTFWCKLSNVSFIQGSIWQMGLQIDVVTAWVLICLWILGPNRSILSSEGYVKVPEELKFPNACCVGIASQTALSIFNPTERWLQVSIGILSISVNGEKVRVFFFFNRIISITL